MIPGKCINETMRSGSKSFCEPWQTWTNCREVGHCMCPKSKQQQLSFDLFGEDEEDPDEL